MTKQYLILGLGKSGLSAASYLCHQSAKVVLADTREQVSGLEEFRKSFPDVNVYLGDLSLNLLKHIDILVISPGLSPKHALVKEAKQRGIDVIGDIELFCQQANSPIIAITGTNAKSTVVTLIAKIISDAGYSVGLGGNIGMPALDLLNEAESEPDFYVLELSSFQLESTSSLKAMVAAILNVTPDHMDRYDNFNDYVKTKQRIYHNCEVALYNRDDENTYPTIDGSRNISFGTDKSNCHEELSYSLEKKNTQVSLLRGDEPVVTADMLRLSGTHNYLNCLAALGVCDVIGIQREKQIQSLRAFSGLAHRCETITDINGVRWVNDSKGTNVGATLAALKGFSQAFPQKIILILGGVSKDAGFSSMINEINQSVKNVLVYGQDSSKIVADFSGQIHCPIETFETLEQVVKNANKLANEKNLVLFSPACASFDMFENFEHRGDIFRGMVLSLKSSSSNSLEVV